MTVIGWFDVKYWLPDDGELVLIKYRGANGEVYLSNLIWMLLPTGEWRAPASPKVPLLNPYQWSYIHSKKARAEV